MKINNKNGFTLVELLATIVILGIISVIAVVSITSIVNHSKVVECENIVLSLKSAVKEYVSDGRYSNNKIYDGAEIKVSTLMDDGYFSTKVTNPFTKKDVTSAIRTKKITIYLSSDKSVIYTDSTKSTVGVKTPIKCDGTFIN